MVGLLLELTAPSERLWIVGQPAAVVMRDAMHLLVRAWLLTTCTMCG
jgi:hypothetical protein